MQEIKDQEFGGERPLYCSRDLLLSNVTIHPGESSLKECRNIEANDCRFEGKYVFWENDNFRLTHCFFAESARSSLWYSRGVDMRDCVVEAPKMFRRTSDIRLRGVRITNAEETLWDCDTVDIDHCEILNADYLFMHTGNIRINDYHQEGNYSFQYSRNVEISNALINSKDAFWDTENVTVRDSEINGEYLGWYSRNLTLINCKISGTQPLCYCDNLRLVGCTLDADADLAFEYCTVEAQVNGHITSVKNPTSGHITAGSIGEVIIDANCRQPANCVITTSSK